MTFRKALARGRTSLSRCRAMCRVVTGSRSPLRNPFPSWGDCILPLGWLSKQKCQGGDFANLLTPKPAEMQGNALGLQWAGSYTRREEVWGNG